MENSALSLDILEVNILPQLLDMNWDGYRMKPVLDLVTICKQIYNLLFGEETSVERKMAVWCPLFRGNRRECAITLADNMERMEIPRRLVESFYPATKTYCDFPELIVKEMGMSYALKIRFREQAASEILGPLRNISPMLVIEGEAKDFQRGRPPNMGGMGCFVDSKGRYGEGELNFELMTARNWMGMRTMISSSKINRGKMILPGGTKLEGSFGDELLEGTRYYKNGTISGVWSLDSNTSNETYSYVKLENGKLTTWSLDDPSEKREWELPESIDLSGNFDSPHPLEQQLMKSAVMFSLDIDSKEIKISCNNKTNEIEIS